MKGIPREVAVDIILEKSRSFGPVVSISKINGSSEATIEFKDIAGMESCSSYFANRISYFFGANDVPTTVKKSNPEPVQLVTVLQNRANYAEVVETDESKIRAAKRCLAASEKARKDEREYSKQKKIEEAKGIRKIRREEDFNEKRDSNIIKMIAAFREMTEECEDYDLVNTSWNGTLSLLRQMKVKSENNSEAERRLPNRRQRQNSPARR